ncbi:hypothetical protein D3C78_1670630 [compost metagenome]
MSRRLDNRPSLGSPSHVVYTARMRGAYHVHHFLRAHNGRAQYILDTLRTARITMLEKDSMPLVERLGDTQSAKY